MSIAIGKSEKDELEKAQSINLNSSL